MRTGLLLLLALWAPLAAAQPSTPEVLGTAEVAFTSAVTYADPHRDGALRVTFTGPAGETVTVDGFWDGESTFRARFAPTAAGVWTYASAAQDTANPGLHGVTGQVEVAPYTGTDPFRTRGWPRVSASGHHLTYGDGSPFFLLADWAAEISWRSLPEDVSAYLADRAGKGFLAIQAVASSHNRHFPEGVTNRLGEPLHPPFQASHLNPRYFDHLDAIVSEANARGLAVMLYPVWAATVEVHSVDNDWYGWYVPNEDALFRARYVAARYAGHNVIWVIGGDQYYARPEARDFWRTVAAAVKEASGGSHLMTAHSSGWSATYQFFSGPEDDWLDFHSYTPGHWAGGDWSYTGALTGGAWATGKPLFNTESNFEDLFHRFWDFTADTTATFRLRDVHAREAAYWGVLSGALGGYSYGANGIWQWTNPETVMDPGDFWPRHTAIRSMAYPGSAQIPLMRTFLEEVEWTRLGPRQDLLLQAQSDGHVAVAAGGNRLVAYLPATTPYVVLSTTALQGELLHWWVDPRTGQPSAVQPATRPKLTVAPPDGQDWLLVVSSHPPSNAPEPPSTRALQGSLAPNPFRGETALHLQLPAPAPVEVTVYDVLGRLVLREEVPAGGEALRVPLALPVAGVYVCHVRAVTPSGPQSLALRLTSLGR